MKRSGLQTPVPIVGAAVVALVALVIGGGIGATLSGGDADAAAETVSTPADDTTPSSSTTTTQPTTTTVPTTTTEPEPEVGSRENPVPVGTPFELGGALVTVTSIDLEADSWLVDHDERNAAPEAGWRHVIVHRTIENIGDDGFRPLVHPTATGVGSEFFSGLCLDVRYWPDHLGDEPTIYPGGSAEGASCMRVPTDEIDSGAFLIEFSALPDRVYVSP